MCCQACVVVRTMVNSKGRPQRQRPSTSISSTCSLSKDSLDQVHNVVKGPPLLTFQTVGRDVTFFLAAKVDNTVVHAKLSTVRLPAQLTDVHLEYFFFRLFQV